MADAPSKPRRLATRDVPADWLANIKDDLGIAADDTSQDEWLARRIAGIWTRFETYCQRTLACPPVQFVDNWGEIAPSGYPNLPPVLRAWPRASVFLRQFPVISVDEVKLLGSETPIDVSQVQFDADTGKLLTLDTVLGRWGAPIFDLGHRLLYERAVVIYTAGFAELPLDIYEALIACITMLWGPRSAQASGLPGGGGAVTKINVIDVGGVDVSAANLFEETSTKKGNITNDPLLGPYTALLDPYVDLRALAGSTMQATSRVAPVAP